jgi:hypothetical protein
MVEITLLAQCLRRKCTTRATSPIWWDALAIVRRILGGGVFTSGIMVDDWIEDRFREFQ